MTGRRGYRVRLLALISAMVAVMLVSPGARAADPTQRISIVGSAGLGRLAMSDVNGDISAGNAYLRSQHWKTLGSLHMGFNFGYDLRARFSGPFTLSVGGAQVLGRDQVDFKQVISVKPTAGFYHVRLLYQLPFRPRPSMRLSLGAGPVYTNNAKVTVTHEVRQDDNVGYDRSTTAKFSGSGWGAHAFMQAETNLNQKVALVADLGYRWASISRDAGKDSWTISGLRGPGLADTDGDTIIDQYDLNPGTDPAHPGADRDYMTESFLHVLIGPDGKPLLDNNGRPATTPRGGDLGLDFSGVLVNVGLRFYLF